MHDFKITVIENQTLVADSRDIAKELGIEHDNFMQTIEKRKASIEAYFGHLLFKTGTVTNSVKAKNQVKYCLLTEDQYIAVATLSRNTAKVIEVKMRLVKAFSLAKQALKEVNNASNTSRSIPFDPDPAMDSMVEQIRSYALTAITNTQTIGDIAELSRTLAAYHREYGEIKLLERNLLQARAKLHSRFTPKSEAEKSHLPSIVAKIVYEFTQNGEGFSIPCKLLAERCEAYSLGENAFSEIYRVMDGLGYTRKETPKGVHWVSF